MLRLLDLCCGGGGAAVGYSRAGFEVYGIDNDPKPLRHYPFPWLCADALGAMDRLLAGEGLMFSDGTTLYLRDFDAIHASPPCQDDSILRVSRWPSRIHANLIAETRTRLVESRLPFVIENVTGARRRLIDPVQLCGSSFGLPLRRHRLFETTFPVMGG